MTDVAQERIDEHLDDIDDGMTIYERYAVEHGVNIVDAIIEVDYQRRLEQTRRWQERAAVQRAEFQRFMDETEQMMLQMGF